MAVHLQQSSMVKTTSHEEDRSSHVTHRFMLAHGNFGGAWVWAEFERELSSRGHTVYALDLPWERDPETGQVPGISDQAQHIKDLISSRQLKGVVLVGASNGGLPVIQVSAGAQVSCPLRCVFSQMPDSLSAAVFLSATIVTNGASLSQDVPDPILKLCTQRAQETGGYFTKDLVGGVQGVKKLFYPESTDAEVEVLYGKMHPEPLRSWTDILVLPDGFEDAFKKVPFHYIRFTDDEGLRPGFYAGQSQRLLSHFPNSYAHELPGCHFAFKYQPKMVADLLENILAQ